MIQYFKNQTLSQKLSINLSKWKRWSREFLPPDPLGGMQSGYARQYSLDEAFTVYIGGCLVSDLNFSIPDARQIIQDLSPWLSNNGFRFDTPQASNTHEKNDRNLINHYLIFIFKPASDPIGASQPNNRFCYLIRGVLSTRTVLNENNSIIEEQYMETLLPASTSTFFSLMAIHPIKLLNITALINAFIQNLKL